MANVIKSHWKVFIVALAVSMVFGGQHLVFLRSLGAEQYQPVTVAADYDTATVYFPRAKAVYDGQWKVGDINLIEYQGSPAPMPMLNPIVMGTLSRLLGSMKASQWRMETIKSIDLT